jgi:hypothetical protein
MTDDAASPSDLPSIEGPGNRDLFKPVWYRRRWVLVTAGVVAVVVISVLVDLPRPTTLPQDVSAQTSVMNEVNGDVAGCAYAVRESFTIYQDMKTGSLSASDRSQVPTLLRDDQTACSFTNSSIFDLSSVEPPGSPAGKKIGQTVNVVTLWATSDALAAIEDVQTLDGNTGSATTVADLAKQEHLLAVDRAQAIGYVRAADQTLGGAHLPMPNLPDLPHLIGTG